jgi:hypothetical protein
MKKNKYLDFALKTIPFIPVIGISITYYLHEIRGIDVGLKNPIINILSAFVQAVSLAFFIITIVVEFSK